MPIATGDGRYFEDEFEYAVSQLDQMHNETYAPATGAPSAGTAQLNSIEEMKNVMSRGDFNERWFEPEQMDNDSPGVEIDVDFGQEDRIGSGLSADRLKEISPAFPNWDWKKFEQVAPMSPNVEDRRGDDPRGFYIDPKNPDIRIHRFEGEDEDLSKLPRITVTPERPPKGERYGERFIGQVGEVLGKVGEKAIKTKDIFTGSGGEERLQVWPERMVRGVINAFEVLGRVGSGELDYRDESAITAAGEVAGAIILGPAPIAMKAVDGTLGSIAGIRAQNLSKESLTLARIMDKEGASRDAIWKTTGLYKGVDRLWRHELDTSNAYPTKLMANYWNTGTGELPKTLGEMLDFPQLYKAYPQLKDMKVSFNTSSNPKLYGEYDMDSKEIRINLNRLKEKGDDYFSTLIHEVQHAIQHIEGFEYGITQKTITKTFSYVLTKLQESGSEEDVKKFLGILEKYLIDPKTGKPDAAKIKEIKQETYKRSPGEHEAKIIEKRMDYTPEQRYAKDPLTETEEILAKGNVSAYRSKLFPMMTLEEMVENPAKIESFKDVTKISNKIMPGEGFQFTLDEKRLFKIAPSERQFLFKTDNGVEGLIIANLAGKDKDTIHIGWIGNREVGKSLSTIKAQHTVGGVDIRQVLKNLKEQFPQAKYVEGFRVTGANPLQNKKIKLPELEKK